MASFVLLIAVLLVMRTAGGVAPSELYGRVQDLSLALFPQIQPRLNAHHTMLPQDYTPLVDLLEAGMDAERDEEQPANELHAWKQECQHR